MMVWRQMLVQMRRASYSCRSFAGVPEVIRLEMPALSPTMTSGNVGAWHKAVGDRILAGEAIVSIETDKAQVEFDSVEEGFLAGIYVKEGTEGVPCGELLGIMVEDEDDLEAAMALTPPKAPSSSAVSEEKSENAVKSPGVAKSSSATATQRKIVMPSAANILGIHDIAASLVKGTGPGGRVLKSDALQYISEHPASADASSNQLPSSSRVSNHRDTPYVDKKVSTMRRVIATRLLESKSTIPHAYASCSCTIDNLLQLRVILKEKGIKCSLNDFVILASALALRDVPALNSYFDVKASQIKAFPSIDISVAVATEGGLITPIITGADQRDIPSISSAVKDLAQRARLNKLKPEEYQGGSFTISNLGMFGISEFSAIINLPQACILAVSAGQARTVMQATSLATETAMNATLSYDRRVVNEASAGQWLSAFKKYMQHPATMSF